MNILNFGVSTFIWKFDLLGVEGEDVFEFASIG